MYKSNKLFKDSPTVRKNTPKYSIRRIKQEFILSPINSKCTVRVRNPLTGKESLCHLYKDHDNNIRSSRTRKVLNKELNGYIILDYVITQTLL